MNMHKTLLFWRIIQTSSRGNPSAHCGGRVAEVEGQPPHTPTHPPAGTSVVPFRSVTDNTPATELCFPNVQNWLMPLFERKHRRTVGRPTFAVSLALTAMTRVLAGISMSRTVFHPPGRKFVLTPSTWSSTISSSAVMESLLVPAKQNDIVNCLALSANGALEVKHGRLLDYVHSAVLSGVHSLDTVW